MEIQEEASSIIFVGTRRVQKSFPYLVVRSLSLTWLGYQNWESSLLVAKSEDFKVKIAHWEGAALYISSIMIQFICLHVMLVSFMLSNQNK